MRLKVMQYVKALLYRIDSELLKLLNAHPTLRRRVEALMSIVEDTAGTIEKADAAEYYIIEEVRKIGHAALTELPQIKSNPEPR